VTNDADRLSLVSPGFGAGAVESREIIAASGVDHPLTMIMSCMVVGTVALMILGVQPVLLGALTQAHRLTEAQLGVLATVEILTLALGSAIGPRFVRNGAMWQKTAILSLLLAAANMGIYVVHSVLMLELLRGTAGLIEGLMLGANIVITTVDRHPDRLNAIFLAASTLPQAIMAYLLPVWIVPHYGANGGFAVLACLSVLSAVCAVFLANGRSTPEPEASPAPIWTSRIIFALAAVIMQYAATGGAWDYIQLLAEQHHFTSKIVGMAVSGGLLFQVGGTLAVAAWGWRIPFKVALITGSLCQAVIIVLLAVANSPLVFIGPALTFGLFSWALYPFQVSMLIDLDKTRNAALILTAITLLGFSIGPALSAWGVRGANVTGAFWVAAGLMLGSTVLYSLASMRPVRRQALRVG
jgi:DHA1 family inner membrane transport protein